MHLEWLLGDALWALELQGALVCVARSWWPWRVCWVVPRVADVGADGFPGAEGEEGVAADYLTTERSVRRGNWYGCHLEAG